MTFFLFTVDVPDVPTTSYGFARAPAWQCFETAISGIGKLPQGASRLQLNVWLLTADGAWHTLSRLAGAADTNSLTYKILLIDGDVTMLTPP